MTKSAFLSIAGACALAVAAAACSGSLSKWEGDAGGDGAEDAVPHDADAGERDAPAETADGADLPDAGGDEAPAETLDAPDGADGGDATEGADAPGDETAGEPDAAAEEAVEPADAVDAVDVPDVPETVDAADTSDAIETIDTVDAVDAIDAVDATDTPDTPDTVDVPVDEVKPDAVDAVDAEAEEVSVRCDAVSGGVLYVDPLRGSDSSTGSGMSGGVLEPACAFKTITHAVGVLLPALSVEVRVIGPSEASAATGETFPIPLPSAHTVVSYGGVVTVRVPNAAVSGFRASNALNAALRHLVVDGFNSGATPNPSQVGVAVTGTGGATLTGVTVRNMGGTGIVAGDTATATIRPGTSANNNGTAHGTGTGHGLAIVQNARGVVSGAGSEFGISFNGNWGAGIVVTQGGVLELAGTPGTGGAGTVTTNDNGGSGVLFYQPSSMSILGMSSIDGLVAWSNDGDGIRIAAESSVKVRNSYILANLGSGVYVTGDTTHWSVARIDLGHWDIITTDPGRNTLQVSTGGGRNRGAGVCLNTGPPPTGMRIALDAVGNIFAGPKDCWTFMPPYPVVTWNRSCTTGVDVGIVQDRTSVDIDNCAYPP